MTHKQSSVETDISGIKITIIYSSKKLRSGAISLRLLTQTVQVFLPATFIIWKRLPDSN